jgi:hypothetical protein
MNKLTITDKVFVPVTFAEELPDYLYEIYTITQGLINKGLVKEETNKYVLSREEMEQVISNVIKLSRKGTIETYKSDGTGRQVGAENFKYTNQEIINSIL